MRITQSVPVRIEVVALVVALLGMALQIATGVHYGTVPPGVVILVVLAALLAFIPLLPIRILGVAVSAFILLGVFVSTNGRTSLGHPGHLGPFTGTLIQLAALVVAVIAGFGGLVEWGATRRRNRAPGRRSVA